MGWGEYHAIRLREAMLEIQNGDRSFIYCFKLKCFESVRIFPTENAFASNTVASDRELVWKVCEWISECASGTSHR